MAEKGNGASTLVLHSVRVLANPSSSQADKKEAQLILTKVEQSHVSTTLGVAGELCRQKEDAVALFGYSLLGGVARKRWKECTDQEKKDIAQFSWKCLVKAGDVGPSKPICAAVCEIFGLIMIKDAQSSLLPGWKKTMEFGSSGPRQFDLACRVGQVICEQAKETEIRGTTNEAKIAFRMAQRYLIKALSTVGKESIVFFFKGVESYYQQGVQFGKMGDQQSVKACGSIVKSGLDTVSEFADFVPLTDLDKSGAIAVFHALMPFPEFREALMNILDKLFCRDDLEEAEVETGAKFGAIALERLERLHAKRRENKLDATERDFEEVQKVVTTTTHFAMAYAERISSDENRLEHLLAQVLSIFKFKSIEIAAMSLPFWSRILNSRALIPLNEVSQRFKRALSAIAKDLAMCLFGLYEHMKTSTGAEDNLQNHAGIEEFREEHGPQVNTCLTNFSQLFPHIIRSHIAAVSIEASKSCGDGSVKTDSRVILLRRLSLILEQVSIGKVAEADEIKLALSDTLDNLLAMDIGNQMELAFWFGDALRSCTKAVKLNNDLTLSLITTTINMLCRLPMGTAGMGLPLVSEEKYKTYSEARMNLCLIVRSLVEQTPGPMLLHIHKLMARIEKAKKSQWLSASEYIAFAEVAILASQSASIDCQKEILSWSLEPLRVSWKSKTWIYRPSSEAAFGDVYLAYDINPDASTTMVGHDSRWELYHEIQLLSKVLSRCPRKKWRYAGDGTPESPIDEALDLVFVIGKIARSIQSLWEICENHTVWKNIVSMKASPNGVKLTELQEGLAVSGTTIESCRLWLEVLFRQCSVILGTTGSICPSFWSHEHLSQRLPSLVTESVDRTSIVLCKDLLEQVIIPWIKFCPQPKHNKWVLPVLESVPHIHKKIKDGWSALEDDQPEDVEIEMALQDHLQDITEQFAKLLAALSLGSTDETRGTKSKSVFDKLLDARSPQCGEIIHYSLDLLSLRNWSIIEPVAQFCRCVVAVSHRHKDIQEFVTTDMLPMALDLLFDRNMAPVVASLILLLGEILAKYLGSDGSVTQCMMRLPGMTELRLESLAKNLMCGQRMKDHLQDTLMACCGSEMPALGLS